ncbi:MAG TPA: acyl carrier protein [Streptosporangiaceae bacterium]
MTIQQSIITYVADAWMGGDADGLGADLPLAEMNIIDSAAMFDLVHFLQGTFRIQVPLDEVTPRNFTSINAITALVERLRDEGAPR